MDRLNDYPIKELICHPRLGVDLYRGEPDLKGFSRIRDRCRLPLVYNGDILSIEDFLRLKKTFLLPFGMDDRAGDTPVILFFPNRSGIGGTGIRIPAGGILIL